jgi:ABC-type hemin transport system substrate-binding protein
MCYDELAATAFYANDMMAGLEASNVLLEQKKFPEEHKERIVANFQQYAQWLTKQTEAQKIMEQEKLKAAAQEKAARTKAPAPRRKKSKKAKSR